MIKKKHINLIGGGFQHAHCSTWWKKPEYIIWNYESKQNDITVYVDNEIEKCLSDNDNKIKYGWLQESKLILPHIHNKIKNNHLTYLNKLNGIFTCDEELLNVDKKFLWVPAYGVSIEKYGGNKKTKLMSMITSHKTMTHQQNFRVNFAKQNKGKFDLYGVGFNPIKNKNDGLDDYMFSVAIENATYDTYFTEKILDCFASKTIPIYKGTKKICNYFDCNGIIFLDDINNDLSNIK